MRESPARLGDSDVRPALRSLLERKHATEPGTVILDELGLCRGRVRVDLAVVNGLLHGYEIKSDRDSLRRLGDQVDVYSQVLDRATLVVGERHRPKAVGAVPDWWGLLLVGNGVNGPWFRVLRRGRKNPRRRIRALVELLWLDEAMALLESRQATRGVRGKARQEVWDRVCEHFSLEEIATSVRSQLKIRARRPVVRQPV